MVNTESTILSHSDSKGRCRGVPVKGGVLGTDGAGGSLDMFIDVFPIAVVGCKHS
jgi:hypothetical protein